MKRFMLVACVIEYDDARPSEPVNVTWPETIATAIAQGEGYGPGVSLVHPVRDQLASEDGVWKVKRADMAFSDGTPAKDVRVRPHDDIAMIATKAFLAQSRHDEEFGI